MTAYGSDDQANYTAADSMGSFSTSISSGSDTHFDTTVTTGGNDPFAPTTSDPYGVTATGTGLDLSAAAPSVDLTLPGDVHTVDGQTVGADGQAVTTTSVDGQQQVGPDGHLHGHHEHGEVAGSAAPTDQSNSLFDPTNLLSPFNPLNPLGIYGQSMNGQSLYGNSTSSTSFRADEEERRSTRARSAMPSPVVASRPSATTPVPTPLDYATEAAQVPDDATTRVKVPSVDHPAHDELSTGVFSVLKRQRDIVSTCNREGFDDIREDLSHKIDEVQQAAAVKAGMDPEKVSEHSLTTNLLSVPIHHMGDFVTDVCKGATVAQGEAMDRIQERQTLRTGIPQGESASESQSQKH